MKQLNLDNWFVCTECSGISYRFDCCNNTFCNSGGCDSCSNDLWDCVKNAIDSSEVPENIKQDYRDLLFNRLGELMNKDFLPEWLSMPNDGFLSENDRLTGKVGIRPINLLNSDNLNEVDKIWKMIYFLESGQPL